MLPKRKKYEIDKRLDRSGKNRFKIRIHHCQYHYNETNNILPADDDIFRTKHRPTQQPTVFDAPKNKMKWDRYAVGWKL